MFTRFPRRNRRKTRPGLFTNSAEMSFKNVLIEINDDCLLARSQYITTASNNCLTSLFYFSHIRKLPYPTAAMYLKGQEPISNYADISFEKKICSSFIMIVQNIRLLECHKVWLYPCYNSCYPPPADSHVFNEQKSFPNTLLIYHKNTCSGYASWRLCNTCFF